MLKFFRISFLLIFCLRDYLISHELPITVIIPSYNNASCYRQNLDSVFSQNYSNFRVIYTVDGHKSPLSDGTGQFVQDYIKEKKQEHRVTLILNNDRQMALRNWYKAILSCDPNDIVVALDGDDALAGPHVLSYINSLYNRPGREVWFTYGNFKLKSTGQVWQHTYAIPEEIIKTNAIRSWGNGPTHLKTFKAWLFQAINIADFFYEHDFYTMCADIAMYTPMIEMAAKHYIATQEVLHEYNDLNPLNDHKIDRSLQVKLDAHIRARKPYNSLEQNLSGRIITLQESNLLKASIIIFSDKPENLERLCSTSFIQDNLQKNNIKDIYVLYQADKYDYQAIPAFSNINLVAIDNKLKPFRMALIECLKSCLADYVLIAHDQHDFEKFQFLSKKINIADTLYWLELTHAYNFNLADNKTIIQQKNLYPILVTINADDPKAIYAYRHNKAVSAQLSMNLIRKKDISAIASLPLVFDMQSLEKVWKMATKDLCVGLVYAS